MRASSLIACLAGALCLFGATGAFAQSSLWGAGPNLLVPRGVDRALTRSVATSVLGDAAAPPRPVAPGAWAFQPRADLRAAAYADFVGRIAMQDPTVAIGLGSIDLFALMAVALVPYGLRVDDLADATTVYAAELWSAANGLDDDLEPVEAQTLSRRFAAAYQSARAEWPQLANPIYVQRLTDELLLQAWLIAAVDGNLDEGALGQADIARYRDLMVQTGRDVLGVDLRGLRLDEVEPGIVEPELDEPEFTEPGSEEPQPLPGPGDWIDPGRARKG